MKCTIFILAYASQHVFYCLGCFYVLILRGNKLFLESFYQSDFVINLAVREKMEALCSSIDIKSSFSSLPRPLNKNTKDAFSQDLSQSEVKYAQIPARNC